MFLKLLNILEDLGNWFFYFLYIYTQSRGTQGPRWVTQLIIIPVLYPDRLSIDQSVLFAHSFYWLWFNTITTQLSLSPCTWSSTTLQPTGQTSTIVTHLRLLMFLLSTLTTSIHRWLTDSWSYHRHYSKYNQAQW